MNGQTLEQKITAFKELGQTLPEIPESIKSNLNSTFELRPYQEEAFSRFLFYYNNQTIRQKPSQILFHMATGSGKTLIMAGLILYLYEQGYRNFLFFVNSTNIINKTRENFLNPASIKYLFAESLSFSSKQVTVKEVDNFQAVNEDDINIVFTTIQGLHSRLNTPRENSLTYEDFSDKKIVLISDEAHHINAETKRKKDLTKTLFEEVTSWEGTVNRIFRSNIENLLLEFTATADLSNEDVANKYFDKILFDYSLKQFRLDGYSKEVKVLQADISNIDRALQACLLSQFRRKIFEKNRLHIKPVVLLKSKKIDDSKLFFDEFTDKIKTLKISDINKLNSATADNSIKEVFSYIKDNNINIQSLVDEIKEDFSEDKCIVVNSKSESEEKQIAVNTLEDPDNEYRAIFVVDMLNEGWDVLNLFDIVRLYNTRDKNTKTGQIGKTTISEAQLIGRGARYCPFSLDITDPKFQRKYDEDIDNELRICEELYYHSAYNPKYIHELNEALHEMGIKPKESREIQLDLKFDFKESDFYNNGLVFLNQKIENDRKDIFSLPTTITKQTHKVRLQTGYGIATAIFESEDSGNRTYKIKDFKISDFDNRVVRKALSKLDFYHFNNLKSFLPNIQSISEFIISEDYLKNVSIELEGPESVLNELRPEVELKILIEVLEKVSHTISSENVEFKGTKKFEPYYIKKKLKNKRLNIYVNDSGDQEYGIGQNETRNTELKMDLSEKDWYVFNENYGTSEEKYLVRYIDKMYEKLKEKYDTVYLVRNEKHFQIFNFQDGRPFEPDFLLFLSKKEQDISIQYQVFIEPKGEHLIQTDKWKEDFLKELKDQHKIEVLWKNKDFNILGMPFYNERIKKQEFDDSFKTLVE
ncbi:DEAD/DEAH box helicase family protein [Salinispira pacifica]|uniref:Type III restriction-modification system DNA endonuclease res n=1 Tax=Salinispira pacifica TaxID=1307761 RepID=V5WG19_9SPIO|nr:DEAD/DEAH box helicase family protein [Salinispira pacifica]AHC14499.1 Type III restriction-modification system DNA endonuclease res [Salinispira pacifica]